MSNYRHRLPAAIERLDAMPALAESRNRVLRVLLDLDSREDDLVTAIESDVALVVAVMRLANADERKRGRIATVPEAVRVLAPEGVETLARRIGVYGFFERLPGWQVPPERFRLHAVAVAGTADMIAREIEHPRRDELLVAALLHDLGKVVMADAYPGLRRADVGPEHVARGARARRAARVRRRPRGHRRRAPAPLAPAAGDRARGRAAPLAGGRRRGGDPLAWRTA